MVNDIICIYDFVPSFPSSIRCTHTHIRFVASHITLIGLNGQSDFMYLGWNIQFIILHELYVYSILFRFETTSYVHFRKCILYPRRNVRRNIDMNNFALFDRIRNAT